MRTFTSAYWLPSGLNVFAAYWLVRPVAAAEEEPEPVLDDRSPQAVVHVIQAKQLSGSRDATALQILVDVDALKRTVGKQQNLVPAERVAAGARDPVDDDARQLMLGRASAHVHRNLLRLHLVVVDAGALAGAHHAVGDHAVDERPRVGCQRSVHRQRAARPHRRRAADVEPGRRRPRAPCSPSTCSCGRSAATSRRLREMTSRRALVCTSTTGDSPVTVIVSSTEPIASRR